MSDAAHFLIMAYHVKRKQRDDGRRKDPPIAPEQRGAFEEYMMFGQLLTSVLLPAVCLLLAWLFERPGLWRAFSSFRPTRRDNGQVRGYSRARSPSIDLRDGDRHFGAPETRVWRVWSAETIHAGSRRRVVTRLIWTSPLSDEDRLLLATRIAQVTHASAACEVTAVEWIVGAGAEEDGATPTHVVIFSPDGKGWTGRAQDTVLLQMADRQLAGARGAVASFGRIAGGGWFSPPLPEPEATVDKPSEK